MRWANEEVEFPKKVHLLGGASFGNTSPIDNNAITGATTQIPGIDPDKLRHRHVLSVKQVGGTDVVSRTEVVHLCLKTGVFKSIVARVETAPVGGLKQFTVDIEKAVDGSNTWTSLLASPITFADGDADNTLKTGTLIGSPITAEGDAIRIVVTASGATGSQGQGLAVVGNLDEQPI